MSGGAERGKRQSREDGPDETAVTPAGRGKSQSRKAGRVETDLFGAIEARIARIATRQKGLITRRQLLDAGLSGNAIDRRIRNGSLIPVFRGVYLVGHAALAPYAREAGALLMCGERAVVSHDSAAHLWSILPECAEVHVTLTDGVLHSRPRLRIHEASLSRSDIRVRHDLPTTTPARTLLDLAATNHPHLEAAYIEAFSRRLIRPGELEKAVARAHGHRGVRALRALANTAATGVPRSQREADLRRLIKAARLPEPRSNAKVNGYMVDFHWPAERLVVEFDGYAFHGHRSAFETDRRRDGDLVAAGYRVIRVTAFQLEREPFAVLANLAGALATDRLRPQH